LPLTVSHSVFHLGHPLDNGLYDLRMGPFSDRNIIEHFKGIVQPQKKGGQMWCQWIRPDFLPGLEKTRVFKKKPSPVGFFGFFLVFWFFWGFLGFFLPRREGF
jgi:hypothetical protein